MLLEIHDAIRVLLFSRGGIDPTIVDVQFEPPTRQSVDSLTRPTINFFLLDIQENTDLRNTTIQTTRGNGHVTHRLPPRRFDLRYMVSVLTTVVEDEYLLLWRTLATLLKYQQLPQELIPESLRTLEPALTTKIEKPDEGPRLLDVWSAFEVPPRPALLYAVTAPMDLNIAIDAPLVLTSVASYTRGRGTGRESRYQIGGVVHDPQGAPVAGAKVVMQGSAGEGAVTSDEGRFVLSNAPAGVLRLTVTRSNGSSNSVSIEVPSHSYELVVS
jgi:hypothetical protein